MGGSGGGYFSGDPRKAIRELQQSQDATDNKEFDAEANQALGALLADFNNRDIEAINRHLKAIRDALQEELKEGTLDLRFGGSVGKRTYVEGLSDIDSLVFLDNCALSDAAPSEAKAYLARRLREEFPRDTVDVGRLAVTIDFHDTEIQLLPAVSCRGSVKIPDSRGDDWATVRPKEFARALSTVNEECGGKVVPVVKLAKAIVATLPERLQLTGYHTEAIAVKTFRKYDGPRSLKEMLKYFFESAARHIQQPIVDITGQSGHVDEYLGDRGSLERRIVSDSLARIARRMSTADLARSVEQWTLLFES